MFKYFFTLIFLYSSISLASTLEVPVSGFARNFPYNHPIANARITVLETGQEMKTDRQGRFGPFLYPVNKQITLQLTKWGYQTTQTGTYLVPQTGLINRNTNITLQVPSRLTYYILSKVIGAKLHDDACHVATTVLAQGKTLDEEPQGEADAIVTLHPAEHVQPFYFDVFTKGWFKNKTNPFTKGLRATSADGGVLFFNLPVSDKPYTLSAEKKGVTFNKVQFICHKNVFINISPPNGPMAA